MTLYPYQIDAAHFIAQTPRCLLLLPMGSGKTLTTLTALTNLTLTEDVFPALVIAPLRVAQSTWPDEVLRWQHIGHLTTSIITGKPAQRRLAVDKTADIYCTNYENLPWLIEHLDGQWPFRSVVCDEVSKLKSFRTRQGSKRAKALAKVVFRSPRFVGLTGTPAPNGLKDLWGQLWFCDRGDRLGKTFSAFSDRWFRTVQVGPNAMAAKLEPFPHSQREIEERIRDITYSLDVRDFLDIKEPIVNTIRIDLPPKAKALYKQMEQEMFMQLESLTEVEAVNAAVKTQKCLQLCVAEGTPVMTRRGWVPIQKVTLYDEVWDGSGWVHHGGVLYQGDHSVVECFGVWMTKDHRVLTKSGWIAAQEILNAKQDQRFNRADVRIPNCRQTTREEESENIVVGDLSMRERSRAEFDNANGHASASSNPSLWMLPREQRSRDDKLQTFPHLVEHEAAVPKPQRQRLYKIRSERHTSLRKMVDLFCRFLERCERRICGRLVNRQNKHVRKLRTGQCALGDPDSANQQYAQQSLHRYSERANDGFGSRKGMGVKMGNAPCSDISVWMGGRTGINHTFTTKTFDIADCGPRNQFVVLGQDGHPLIVHNCNGFVYTDAKRNFEEIHDAKLQALDSVIEEACGAPVLVAYNFKADLARLQARFPQGQVLDADPKTIERWNKGQIPVLFVHPKSAGHGLNLQHGGNILCFFSVDWNLEERLQVIERIGPVRQRQAGYDRPVFIHYLIAKDTIDEVVLSRVDGKKSVLETLMQNLKKA